MGIYLVKKAVAFSLKMEAAIRWTMVSGVKGSYGPRDSGRILRLTTISTRTPVYGASRFGHLDLVQGPPQSVYKLLVSLSKHSWRVLLVSNPCCTLHLFSHSLTSSYIFEVHDLCIICMLKSLSYREEKFENKGRGTGGPLHCQVEHHVR